MNQHPEITKQEIERAVAIAPYHPNTEHCRNAHEVVSEMIAMGAAILEGREKGRRSAKTSLGKNRRPIR